MKHIMYYVTRLEQTFRTYDTKKDAPSFNRGVLWQANMQSIAYTWLKAAVCHGYHIDGYLYMDSVDILTFYISIY